MPSPQHDAPDDPFQPPPPPPWREVARSRLHRGTKFDWEEVTLEDPRSQRLTRQVVRHPGAVIVLPILDASGPGRFALIRNWRHSTGAWLWEFPAGTLEPGEPPERCAARELIEETGFEAATITPLGRFHTSPGLTDELMWAFAGTGLREVGQQLEADERIVVRLATRREVWSLIDRGELIDAKSLAAWMLADRKGLPGIESPE